jgi:hypothetical protein
VYDRAWYRRERDEATFGLEQVADRANFKALPEL